MIVYVPFTKPPPNVSQLSRRLMKLGGGAQAPSVQAHKGVAAI